MQPEADAAWSALVLALENLRLKADKSVLEDLIGSLEGLDLTKYTEESVQVYKAALANAKKVLADENLSEDDQAWVDKVVKELKDARDGLVAKADGTDDGNKGDGGKDDGDKGSNGNNGSAGNSGKSNKTSTPKTGDEMPAAPFGAMAVSGAVILLAVLKKRSEK